MPNQKKVTNTPTILEQMLRDVFWIGSENGTTKDLISESKTTNLA
jgi:hypothetical protein